MSTAAEPARSFRILGPVQAWLGERRLELGGPRQLTLFAFLVLHANRGVSSDVLTDVLWGPRRLGADNRLAMAIARLRKALAPLDSGGGSPLGTVSGGYLLSIGPGEMDAEMFSAAVQDGRRALDVGDPARATELLGDALRLWHGPPLAEVCFENFAQPDIRQLDELRLVALETRIDAELQLGNHALLVCELEGLLATQPTREKVASQLMLALYRSGRQADALDVYQRTRVHLAAALGLQPGPALTALQLEILHHSPSLERPVSNDSESSANTQLSDHGRGSSPTRPDPHGAIAWAGFSSRTSSSQTVSARLTHSYAHRQSQQLWA
jgi:DNA-binding SARP family transcriptional activator